MDEKKFKRIINDLNEYEGVQEVFLLNNEAKVLFAYGNYAISPAEAQKLLNDWIDKNNTITYQDYRFAIIKNEEIQLAAKNISDEKGNIAGSITSEGDYLVVHIAKKTDIILLEWTILVNKLAWS